jgi:hypothetical protein
VIALVKHVIIYNNIDIIKILIYYIGNGPANINCNSCISGVFLM